jgi:Na+/H+ antiporter NhaD/arsenite permease-like protein
MFELMIIVFAAGYACIALEHPLHLNKTATALLLSTLLWVLFALGSPSGFPAGEEFEAYRQLHPDTTFVGWMTHGPLVEHLGAVAEILFFLLGAMTIVEIVDTHGGFRLITDRIATRRKANLLWIVGGLTFVMSAVLDNLTTSIVMVALLRKLIADREDRWMFAGVVVLAANAGGAFSPIGDVTTIMLWIAGRVSGGNIIIATFLASLVAVLVPLAVLSWRMKGEVRRPEGVVGEEEEAKLRPCERNRVFFLGVGALLFVPVFKSVTHLPPYLGMLGGLAVLWMATGFMHRGKPESEGDRLSVGRIISRIDTPSVLFFLGILMAVNALQTCGQLGVLSSQLEGVPLAEPGKYYLISVLIGLFSSVIDNVPLVAGAMGMYSFPTDHYFWEFLAYTAGTGGSILVIGSAAGVAVMGMERMDFIWYLRRVSWLALIGYLAGCGVYVAQRMVMGSA